MKHHTNSRRGWLLSSAASTMTLALALSGQAIAQDDDDTEVITVRGFRSAIESAIEVKRESTSIVEAISAEDIGKLPDNSIAESLARLPGLAAQRLRGRAQVISVRGLGPDFTTALLNGREQVTAGDNRGVEFDQYPSELLSSVLVYKTPDAQLVGQGLAGTADLRTIRPLEQNERTIALSARYEWNEYGALNAGSEDSGHRLTGFYVDQFANDTVGLALGFALQSSPTQGERWDAWGYPTVGSGELVIGGAKPYVESRELERTAFVGTLEFEPSAQWHTTIDAFYSRFEDVGILRGIELPLQWSGASLQPGYTIENGLVTQGQFNGVQGVVRNDTRFREADIFSFGINQQFRPNENWLLEADISFSSVDRDDTDLETYTGTGAGFGNGASDNLGFSLGDGGFVFNSSLNYADPSLFLLTDPQGWGQAGFIKRPSTRDELSALRLSAEREFSQGWISSIEGGIYLTDREKNKTSVEDFIDLANPGATNTTPIPSNLLLSPTSLDFLGISGMVSYDPIAVLNSGVYSLRPNTNPDVVTKAWGVEEQVSTAYLMANVDTQLGSVPVRGNFGVQIVQTEQSSTGARIGRDPQGNLVLDTVTLGDEFTEVLPSANFSFELRENTFLRLGAARTLARARMDQIRASQEISTDSSVLLTPDAFALDPTLTTGIDIANNRSFFRLSGGNPALRPYIADSFDISLEHYFADGGGYLSAALFYKDLQDFVYDNSSSSVDVSAIIDQVSFQEANGDPITAAEMRALNPGIDTGLVSQPSNGEGGHIQGIELAATIPGDIFGQTFLEDFGVMASWSYTDSEITPTGFSSPIQIPGLSERVGNITVFYENEAGFSARISNRWRSEFLGEVTGFGAGREFRDVEAESVVDAQIGYEFSGGRFDGLNVYLQGNNLTDEAFVTYLNDDPRQVKDYQTYGATYLLGISWRR
ncbi:TonB-dependent receptor [Maricaulis parjimensis]|uniref:TonB-dependent receptor n=1 Tax=Maricaulis parjimensis TaxID=144023 RepID=UPI00193A3589|nr:TonB-dependent receptor [Maricaulis parjimensis]